MKGKGGKCKILFISHDGSMAGAQLCILMLCRGLDRERYIPHLIVPYEGELSQRARKLGIYTITRHLVKWVPDVCSMGREGRLKRLWKVVRNLRERSWAIASLIERFDIDLVYSNTVTCLEGAVAASMTAKRHIWHIHEPIEGNDELIPLLPTWLYTNIITKTANSIIYPSNVLRQCYTFPPNKVHVVYNGLPVTVLLDRSEAKMIASKKLGVDMDRPWIGIVGTLQPRKNHAMLFQAIKRVRERVPEVALLVIGRGNDEFTEKLIREIEDLGLSDNVKLCGKWDYYIVKFMAAIDVLAISSNQESFGLTAIESLSQETPVVATRCGGPEEIIEDGKQGLLVNVKDPDSMADALVRLLKDSSLRKKLGSAGRKRVINKFSQESYVQGIQKLLSDVCNHRGCGS